MRDGHHSPLSSSPLFILLMLPVWGFSQEGPWIADWNELNRHKAPEWLLDAKIGVQFVGEPKDLDDFEGWHWMRSEWRYRERRMPEADPHLERFREGFSLVGGIPYVWRHSPIADPEAVLGRYKQLGAKFIVSMIEAAYPGTEGFRMARNEIEAARKHGLRVGLHYNLLRREREPSIGDHGFVDFWQRQLKEEVEFADADFVFFDGCQGQSSYLKTAEFMAWYYNWADRRKKEVWVNDDLGLDRMETGQFGDVVDLECMTTDGISPRPWINWDILRNEWTCWVNEFGIHKRTGELWVWEYKPADAVLRIFLDTVSKGGVWLVQNDNTTQSWKVLEEIGTWLTTNGEAIYGTRPAGKPNSRFASGLDPARLRPSAATEELKRLPKEVRARAEVRNRALGMWQRRFEESLRVASQQNVYYTRKGSTLYAIHWGWPEREFVLDGVRPAPHAKVRMLGTPGDLGWRVEGGRLIVERPSSPPNTKWAFTLRIPVREQ